METCRSSRSMKLAKEESAIPNSGVPSKQNATWRVSNEPEDEMEPGNESGIAKNTRMKNGQTITRKALAAEEAMKKWAVKIGIPTVSTTRAVAETIVEIVKIATADIASSGIIVVIGTAIEVVLSLDLKGPRRQDEMTAIEDPEITETSKIRRISVIETFVFDSQLTHLRDQRVPEVAMKNVKIAERIMKNSENLTSKDGDLQRRTSTCLMTRGDLLVR